MDISGQVLSSCSCLLLQTLALPLHEGNTIRASLGREIVGRKNKVMVFCPMGVAGGVLGWFLGLLNVHVGTEWDRGPTDRRVLSTGGTHASEPCTVPLDLVTAVTEKLSVSPVFLPFMKLAAELGECELPEHTPELVSEFRFIPNQTEAMEFDIFQRWKECRYLDAAV